MIINLSTMEGISNVQYKNDSLARSYQRDKSQILAKWEKKVCLENGNLIHYI